MIVVVVVLIFNVYINKDDVYTNNGESQTDRIASVLQNATETDKFGIFSASIEQGDGGTFPTIRIGMDETKSEQELREYLGKSLDKSDLRQYNIVVFKKDIQELEKEHTMLEINGIVYDYIKEKNYKGVQIYYPSIEPEPVIKITISENNELSSEDLKTELENLLASKDFKLLVKDISYKIQVIKS
ncbi:DUF4030 domain-containing protein [Paenisporosarcina sp. OV554]|uniref:DUF4030 domain-containing protein n=1 Tax=Paenisporosarcina sp. OV554 TaxID=2135694 RepID=UPI000D33E5FC|nr:DUF4030 domain-containing protein [Paenisporosarcina sp. OV554]PUB12198.1 uncharacterized protein DUF4030 [Paenisporosarcina sp. OV554]